MGTPETFIEGDIAARLHRRGCVRAGRSVREKLKSPFRGDQIDWLLAVVDSCSILAVHGG